VTDRADSTGARVLPPHRDALDAETVSLLDLTTPAGGRPPPTVAVLAHRPRLLAPFLGWAAALALEGALPKRDHELLALRAAWRCRSSFEWAEHVEYALAAGWTEDEIARVAQEPGAPGWAANEEALLRASDELLLGCAVSDQTWAELAAQYGPAALVEVPFVVGQYTMLSMVANALGIEPEPGSVPLPPSG
jgi:4-carboxymuconolactone decarboxylase